jgi:hypothetical protein
MVNSIWNPPLFHMDSTGFHMEFGHIHHEFHGTSPHPFHGFHATSPHPFHGTIPHGFHGTIPVAFIVFLLYL